MFTGIIKTVGKIIEVSSNKLIVESQLKDLCLGDSISINGVCLTVVNVQNKKFCVEISDETFSKTTLHNLKKNEFVNLEPSMKINDKFGGHFLTGHIETTGEIVSIKLAKDNISKIFTINTDNKIIKYIVPKGSIAVDGISLTVVNVYEKKFDVVIIPYTFENTNLKYKKIGDKINLEPDILAKYIEKIYISNSRKTINFEFLKQTGFLL